MKKLNTRKRLYNELEPSGRQVSGLSKLNQFICGVIILSVGVAIIETEDSVSQHREAFFLAAEYIFTGVFLIEYIARVWVAVENSVYSGAIRGRLKYIVSFYALIDLLALLAVAVSTAGSGPLFLRMFRFARILRLARLGRFSKAMSRMRYALHSRLPDLLLSLGVALGLLVISSTLLYLVEGSIQPKTFGSIPRAMWWGIATLTTVGYGDVYPVTAAGKILSSITAITGIGLIAMPTGILAAAFSDAMQKERDKAS